MPDLEIYIADLWPSELKEDPVSFDRDFVENKKWNLILGDKTDYDEQVANVVTDYVDLTRRLKNLAEKKGASKEINHILNSYATSINTIGKTRIYKALLEGRFRLTKVVHVDLKDDGNEVYDKVFDYSYKTIEELMKAGYNDASIQMDMQRMKDSINELAKINGHANDDIERVDNIHIQELEGSLSQIEEKMKIVDGGYDSDSDMIIKHQIRNFMDIVERMERISPRKEKASLIDAAKQLQDTITRVHQKW